MWSLDGVLGVLIGSVVSWVASRHYYLRAANELKGEAEGLRRLSSMILSAMDQAGLVKLSRDSSGRISGFTYEHRGSEGVIFGGTADAKVVQGKGNSERPRAEQNNHTEG